MNDMHTNDGIAKSVNQSDRAPPPCYVSYITRFGCRSRQVQNYFFYKIMTGG